MYYKVIVPFKREEQSDPSVIKDYYAEGKAYYVFESKTNKLVTNFLQLEGKVKVKANRKRGRLYNLLYAKTRLKMFGPYINEKKIIDVTNKRDEINRYFWFSKKQVHASLTYLSGSFLPESLKIIDRTSITYEPNYDSEYKGRRFVKAIHEYWPRIPKSKEKVFFKWKELNSMKEVSFEDLWNNISKDVEAVTPEFVQRRVTMHELYWWFMRDNYLDEDMFVFADRTIPQWANENPYLKKMAPTIIKKFENLVRTNKVDAARRYLRKKHKDGVEYSKEYKSKPNDFIFNTTSRKKSEIAHIVENKMIKYKLWDRTLTVEDVLDQVDSWNYLLLDHKMHIKYDDHNIEITPEGKLIGPGVTGRYENKSINKKFMNQRRSDLLRKRNEHIKHYGKE